MTPDVSLRKHLVDLLDGGHAYLPTREVLAGWPPEARGTKPAGVAHSAWELLEHLRIAQWDIVRFSLSSDHVSPPFPDGYWPRSAVPGKPGDWDRSLEQFQSDLEAMQTLLSDPAADLHARIPHGDGQTLLREALTLGAHNAYHLGQLMALGKLLGVK